MTLPQGAVSNSCWTIWVLLRAAEHLVQAPEDLRRLEVEHVILGRALRRVEAAEVDRRLRQARAAHRGCKLIRLQNSLQDCRGRPCFRACLKKCFLGECLKKCYSEVCDLFSKEQNQCGVVIMSTAKICSDYTRAASSV
jgi:hypothetical protein